MTGPARKMESRTLSPAMKANAPQATKRVYADPERDAAAKRKMATRSAEAGAARQPPKSQRASSKQMAARSKALEEALVHNRPAPKAEVDAILREWD